MAKKTLREVRPSELQRQIEFEPVKNLLLDSNNPRFAAGLMDKSQEELIKVLWSEFSVDEIALSIAANGFFQEEPLMVVPESIYDKDGPFIVVEGNRRLAAVMLLLDASLRQKVKANDLPLISSSAREGLAYLPVSKYRTRKELWRYLGFRHINGPQPWDSFSKAVYVAAVFDEQGVTLDEIANSIGDKHSTVKRLYRGYKILQQAEEFTSFKRDDRFVTRFAFSHLYTAADQIDFQRYLGIESEESLRPNPVPKNKLEELRYLMTWLYGSKAEKRPPLVQSQNPDLNILRETISQPRGLRALKAGLSLQRSHEISIGDETRFRDSLVRAKEELQVADGTITTGYEGDDEPYLLFQDILKIVRSLNERMDNKRQKTARKSS